MRRKVMIYTATALTAIAATALGGITAASAASAPSAPSLTHVSTKSPGVPRASTGLAEVCTAGVPAPGAKSVKGIAKPGTAVPAPGTKSMKWAAKPGTAVPAPASTSATKPARLAPTRVAVPAEVCIAGVPAAAPASVKKG